MTTKYDVKREFKKCHSPKNTDWELVDVPELHFLAIDGHGDKFAARATSARTSSPTGSPAA